MTQFLHTHFIVFVHFLHTYYAQTRHGSLLFLEQCRFFPDSGTLYLFSSLVPVLNLVDSSPSSGLKSNVTSLKRSFTSIAKKLSYPHMDHIPKLFFFLLLSTYCFTSVSNKYFRVSDETNYEFFTPVFLMPIPSLTHTGI